MAWLKVTHLDGRRAMLNTDQISEISELSGSTETRIRSDGTPMFFRESVEEIGEMIERGEARKRIERIFLAIVCNFPQGYDPDEIWDTANTLHFAGPCRDVIIDG